MSDTLRYIEVKSIFEWKDTKIEASDSDIIKSKRSVKETVNSISEELDQY